MATLPVDVEGLNLLLGGGVTLIKRAENLGESTSLLVRGPPGSGKTLLALQLASSIARQLGSDVAYGCIELLPSELAAQHERLHRKGVPARVIMAPFRQEERRGTECRIFAGILDIGAPGDEAARIDPAITGMLDEVERCGGKARVLVIDSLSDGYRLGSSAPRELADSLCKMAANRGLVLLLLEELVDSRPTAWSFAVDVVIELGTTKGESSLEALRSAERGLAVTKNRFGPSESGIHLFTIVPGSGVRVFPHKRVYLSHWPPSDVPIRREVDTDPLQTWQPFNPPQDWPPFQECITTIYGAQARMVKHLARTIGSFLPGGQRIPGHDLIFDFAVDEVEAWKSDDRSRTVIGVGDPFLSGDQMLADAVGALEKLLLSQTPIRRVLIGDFRTIRTFWRPESIYRATGILVALLRRVRLPAVLYETVGEQMVGTGNTVIATLRDVPPTADIADVVIEIRPHAQALLHSVVNITHARSGALIEASILMSADGGISIAQVKR